MSKTEISGRRLLVQAFKYAELSLCLTNIRVLPLTQGQFSIVDDVAFPELVKNKWWATNMRGVFYAVRRKSQAESVKTPWISMHRTVLADANAIQVDHRNLLTLDNRKRNLRACDRKQNAWNRRKPQGSNPFKGVRLYDGNRWTARISANGKRIQIGSFKTAIEAALAYDEAAQRFYGEFAFLNFPSGSEDLLYDKGVEAMMDFLSTFVATAEDGEKAVLGRLQAEAKKRFAKFA